MIVLRPVSLAIQALVSAIFQLLRWLWASPSTAIGVLLGCGGLASGGRVRAVGRTLEFHGGLVAWLLRRLARGASAMTLGHVILGQTADVLSRVRSHELVHVRQYERWGPFFLPAYGLCALWLTLRGRNGYWDNPFEVAAYGEDHCGQGELGTDRERDRV